MFNVGYSANLPFSGAAPSGNNDDLFMSTFIEGASPTEYWTCHARPFLVSRSICVQMLVVGYRR